MNINYEDIIEKAQQRAEKLKEFQRYAEGVDDKAHELLNLLLYFSNLGARAKGMDQEGQEMLGDVGTRAARIGYVAADDYKRYTGGSGHDTHSLLKLAEELK